jgi:hypothetical protein
VQFGNFSLKTGLWEWGLPRLLAKDSFLYESFDLGENLIPREKPLGRQESSQEPIAACTYVQMLLWRCSKFEFRFFEKIKKET